MKPPPRSFPSAAGVLPAALLLVAAFTQANTSARANDSYQITDLLTGLAPTSSRNVQWLPGKGIALEVGGLEWLPNGRLAVCIRKGEVWTLDPDAPDRPTSGDDSASPPYDLKLFASGLHEPLGLLLDGDDLLLAQRAEITRLKDRDGDGVADAYLTEAKGWSVSGSYHAYVYGPERDAQGRKWVTLNLDMGERSDNAKGWRGWGGVIGKDRRFVPLSCGMRSPCGLGPNQAGDLFFTDQQGTWIPATPLHHLRPGVFYGNQEGLGSAKHPDSPMRFTPPTRNQPYPDALRQCPEMVPPAVWLPYNKMGRSATDVELIDAQGKFGPFDGQLLVGEFTNAAIHRVFLEKVNGAYQGACFPFLDGLACAALRLKFAPDGSLFVGLTNRGWSSLGNRSYGLQRIRYLGKPPQAIKEMRATPDGFEVEFTQPLSAPPSFTLTSFTYRYASTYGGPEIDRKAHKLQARPLPARPNVHRLQVQALRPGYVYELHAHLPDARRLEAYYTLNAAPQE